MSDSTEIRMVDDYLKGMVEEMGQVATKMGSLAQPGAAVQLDDAPLTYQAYVDVYNKWSNRRGEILEFLQMAQTTLEEIRQSFNQMDDDMANEANGTP